MIAELPALDISAVFETPSIPCAVSDSFVSLTGKLPDADASDPSAAFDYSIFCTTDGVEWKVTCSGGWNGGIDLRSGGPNQPKIQTALPPVAYFSTRNFPYHDNWLKATISNLMKIAAVWYERNRLQATHGGITVDDRDKLNPYLQVSMQLQEEWKEFVMWKKVQINAGLAVGIVGSPYG